MIAKSRGFFYACGIEHNYAAMSCLPIARTAPIQRPDAFRAAERLATMTPQNRQGTDKPKRQAPKTAFAKGKSGNPGGRPAKTVQELDLIAACKDKTPDALAVITEIMMHGEKEQTRLSAALSIIERAYGKPVQPQDVSLSGVVISRIERVIVDPKR